MTRKEALELALEAVEQWEQTEEVKAQVREKLHLCREELPFARWSEAAIFDACDQFIEERGRPITLKDFDRAGLPSHTTIQNRLGMSARTFRDTYYPLPPAERSGAGEKPGGAQQPAPASGKDDRGGLYATFHMAYGDKLAALDEQG